jgi:hypothetical protein
MHRDDSEQPGATPAPEEHFLVVELLEVAVDRPSAQWLLPEGPPVPVPVAPEAVPVLDVESELAVTVAGDEVVDPVPESDPLGCPEVLSALGTPAVLDDGSVDEDDPLVCPVVPVEVALLSVPVAAPPDPGPVLVPPTVAAPAGFGSSVPVSRACGGAASLAGPWWRGAAARCGGGGGAGAAGLAAGASFTIAGVEVSVVTDPAGAAGAMVMCGRGFGAGLT